LSSYKRGEYECNNREFWWCQSKIKQGCFNKYSKVKYYFKINLRSNKQDQEKNKASNNFTWLIGFCLKTNCFQVINDTGNRLSVSVIDY